MKIAFVHEWLTTYAGSEKVLEVMLELFPEADLFTLVDKMPEKDRGWLAGRKITTSFLQKIPGVGTSYRNLLPLMPLAVEQFDLSGYDVIVSNSHAVAKGVITGPDQLHICYCYTPMRYAWDLQNQYLEESGWTGLRGAMARLFLHRMRLWDMRTAAGVDQFIACSRYIARRIDKVYRRESTVIYPNVAVDRFPVGPAVRDDFYLTSSRLVPYKKMQLIVEAFASMPDRKLVVIGDGPMLEKCKSLATPNVQVMGFQPYPVLLDHMQRAKAFIFASEEDFGIAPVEAQACGTPVLAFDRGGASETVVDGVTGLHFSEQTPAAIRDVVARFETMAERFDPQAIRAHADLFSTERFRREFHDFVVAQWARHRARIAPGARFRPSKPKLEALSV
ncbi:glycosyl transferase [Alsobacter soli]|uniref:Glycosyl transferase n=1 Tax=Alsobacter soli TaxID=2109933 RepID=A0A2T1HYU1_9HYPH|nr:glycosyltransferase family 4 protein [Alsobacter soli]PSC06748.1 glycosyl transferase [Alsobacter soli]